MTIRIGFPGVSRTRGKLPTLRLSNLEREKPKRPPRQVPRSNKPEHDRSRREERQEPKRLEELEHDGTRRIAPNERDD